MSAKFSSLIKKKILNKEKILSVGLNTSPEVEKKFKNKSLLVKETFQYETSQYSLKIIDYVSKIVGFNSSQISLINGGRLSIYLCLEFFKNIKKIIVQDLYFDVTGNLINDFIERYNIELIIWHRENDYSYSLKSIQNQLCPRTLLFFNSPHNPTGWTANKKYLNNLSKLINKHCSYLICDEVYFKIGPNAEVSYRNLTDRVLAFGSFSKLLAAPGLRLGYIISSKKNSHKIKKIIFNMFAGFNPLALKQCLSLLKKFKNINSLINNNISLNLNYLSNFKRLIQYSKYSNGYYRVIKIPNNFKNADQFAFTLLHNENIAIKPCINMGAGSDRLVRLSMITNHNTFKKCISKMDKYYD